MMKSKIFTIVFVVIAVLTSSGCSMFYVVKQGVNQLQLVAGAEPIEMALRKDDLDVNARKKLELILDVRSFSEAHLKLNPHKNYKDINLDWDKRIHAISASEPLRFAPYLWWFPIIGSVPYKGFFSEADADREQKDVERRGYETQKREIHGYSTLGFFADPVWPAMLKMSDAALAELIIHELVHATVYIPNQTPFNETFANFVGKTGARRYLSFRFGEKSDAVKSWDRYEENLKRYHQFFHELYSRLDKVFTSDGSDDDKRQQKALIYAEAKQRYEVLVTENKMPSFDFSMVNNAYLLGFKNYNEDFSVFEKLLSLVGDDFGKFMDEVNYYGRTDSPFVSLHERVEKLGTKK